MCDKEPSSDKEEFVLRKEINAQPSVAVTTTAFLPERHSPLGEQLCQTAGATYDEKLLKGSLQARAIYFGLFEDQNK